MLTELLDVIEAPSATSEDVASVPLPDSCRAAVVFRDEQHMFDRLPVTQRDPRKSLHVTEIPLPEVGPGEALVAVMASSVNYNTVWSSVFAAAHVHVPGALRWERRPRRAARPAVPH